MNREPTVLDYVKAVLTPWRGAPPRLPEEPASPGTASESDGRDGETGAPGARAFPVPKTQITLGDRPASRTESALSEPAPAPGPRPSLPWIALLSLGLALLAQRSLEPGPGHAWAPGALLYGLAAVALVWAVIRREWRLPVQPVDEFHPEGLSYRSGSLFAALALSALAFLALGGNRFNALNLTLWLSAAALFLHAFWLPESRYTAWAGRVLEAVRQSRWQFSISRAALPVLLAVGLVLFFRLYRLNTVPVEMVSDHAEKLLDVADVLDGQWRIFFTRNTGREPLQFYLTAGIANIFGTGISFLSLKIGTVLAGLLTLPFIYLLGKEAANREAGFLAALLAGIAYWPNVISRMGLRFPFNPLFAAPTLYFLARGLRRSNRNDFLLSGLFLGIGLNGYTPFRILPLVVVVAVAIYLLHRQSSGLRQATILRLVLLALVALILFLPLLRYSLDDPQLFGFRAFSRLGTAERPLPGPASEIFLKNLWRGITMFAWDNGEIWPVSVTNRPALDVVTGALFHLGVLLLLVRWIRRRRWLDLFLILSVPLLMLPSILSLAFPDENPALNRAGAALIPVFLIAGIALQSLLATLRSRLAGSGGRTNLAWGPVIVLILWAALQNYDLVFRQYEQQYRASAWNTSEMGAVIADWAASQGRLENAWVLAFPYWVDTRLVGMHAGDPLRDYAVFPEELAATQASEGPKLFLVNLQDAGGQYELQQLYPSGWFQTYDAQTEGKNFLLYFVPPAP